jgi:hypothetical protein
MHITPKSVVLYTTSLVGFTMGAVLLAFAIAAFAVMFSGPSGY